jgi:hypothetical protein
MRFPIRRLLREPLLHFLVLGAALFAAFRWRSEHLETGSKSIVVTQGKDHLANTFALHASYKAHQGRRADARALCATLGVTRDATLL